LYIRQPYLKRKLDREPELLKLANILSALYSNVNEEKRLFGLILLIVPR
jgi:hypothetical protein